MSDEYKAIVHEVDGTLILEDPAAVEVVQAVNKHNCLNTLTLHRDAVIRFLLRAQELELDPAETTVVIINVDDVNGGPIADVLMPNNEAQWQALRDDGEVPFARGLANREGMLLALAHFDPAAAAKMEKLESIPVIVVDHAVAEVYESAILLLDEILNRPEDDDESTEA